MINTEDDDSKIMKRGRSLISKSGLKNKNNNALSMRRKQTDATPSNVFHD